MNQAYNKLCNFALLCPVTFGVGSISTIKDALVQQGVNRVFVVYDQGVKMSGLAEKVTGVLDKQGVDYVTFDELNAEPTEDAVEKAYEVAKAAGCDGVLGLGGGTPMDTAKIVAVLLKQGGSIADWAILTQLGQYGMPRMNASVPSIMVPTSSGTGSEVTCVAVFAYTKNGREGKDGLLSTPSIAIVDPEMTVTCPPLNTISSAMDAFAHAAEAITAKDVDPFSDTLALEAIRLIMENLDAAYQDGKNIDARAKLSMASTLAGGAFSNTQVSFGHCAGHEFGAVFHIGHGLACSYSLPVTLRWNAENNTDRARAIARAMGIEGYADLPPKELGETMRDIIVNMMKKYKVPSLADKGATREACLALAEDSIAHNPMQFAAVCRPLELEEYRALIGEMFDLSLIR